MSVAVITGSAGLVGSAAARHYAAAGLDVVGIDNDLRRTFLGPEASTAETARALRKELGSRYRHLDLDVRDRDALRRLAEHYGRDVTVVVHAAAQTGHATWSVAEPHVDFEVNALGTLNLLEQTRNHWPEATFLNCSSSKVYGDRPNALPLKEFDTRLDLPSEHPYANGITENMTIDASWHTLFGVSKAAADLLVQEYGRQFSLRTACFRSGNITGPAHAASSGHGMLAYLMRCGVQRRPYTVFGHGGRQVRDILHVDDLVAAFDAVCAAPRIAEVYNVGGGRESNCSMLEAVVLVEEVCGEKLAVSFDERTRDGDHRWWIGSNARFQEHYPQWRVTRSVPTILGDIYAANADRWRREAER